MKRKMLRTSSYPLWWRRSTIDVYHVDVDRYFGDECQSDLSHVKATFAFLFCWNLSSHEL